RSRARSRLRAGLLQPHGRAPAGRRTSHLVRRAAAHARHGGGAAAAAGSEQFYPRRRPRRRAARCRRHLGLGVMVTGLGEVPDRAAALTEAARVLRPHGRYSATEAAGDPDRVTPAELDALAAQAGLAPAQRWSGLLVKTFNYRKPSPASSPRA